MFEMNSQFEKLENSNQNEEFDFDKRMDSIDPVEEHHIGGLQQEDVDFDNRIENIDEELETFNIVDLVSLDEAMQFLEPDVFEYLSDGEKTVVMNLLKDKLAEDLNLENIPEIIIEDLEDEALQGFFSPEINAVVINKSTMLDGWQTRNTLAHEMRHAWQHGRADMPENLQNAFDKALKENFENYISPEDNYRAYRLQLVEMDAREYASNLEDIYYYG